MGKKKKRKPRLNTNTSSIMPYRYVLIKIVACKTLEKEKYEVTYTFHDIDYYHDVYGDSKFTLIVCSKTNPYKVGKTYRVPMTIDIE